MLRLRSCQKKYKNKNGTWFFAPSLIRRVLSVLVFYLFLVNITYSSPDIRPPAVEIKAVYLFKFLYFIDWPVGSLPSSGAVNVTLSNDFSFQYGALKLCVWRDHPIILAMRSFDGRYVSDRAVSVEKIQLSKSYLLRLQSGDDSAQENPFTQCNVLFLGAAKGKELSTILSLLENHPVLTVSDHSQFLEKGGMINFVQLSGGHIVFDVNFKVVNKSGIKMRSRLLRAANKVVNRGASIE